MVRRRQPPFETRRQRPGEVLRTPRRCSATRGSTSWLFDRGRRQHLRDLVLSVVNTDAVFPNTTPLEDHLREFRGRQRYPGDEYVDWVGLSAYLAAVQGRTSAVLRLHLRPVPGPARVHLAHQADPARRDRRVGEASVATRSASGVDRGQRRRLRRPIPRTSSGFAWFNLTVVDVQAAARASPTTGARVPRRFPQRIPGRRPTAPPVRRHRTAPDTVNRPPPPATRPSTRTAQHPGIAVIGTGYLGATHAAAMAQLGIEVIGVDTDPDKVAALRRRQGPFYEPGLARAAHRRPRHRPAAVHHRPRRGGRLRRRALRLRRHPAVGDEPRRRPATTSRLRPVDRRRHLTHDGLIVGKSTVPVGTARTRSRDVVADAGARAELVWNPEFLREGKAVQDTLHPDRIVIGGDASRRREALLRRVYADPDAEAPRSSSRDLPTAELVKVACERVPGHQDLLHQRDRRACARRPVRTSPCSPTRSATTSASAGSSSTRGSASAAAACPRTSAP